MSDLNYEIDGQVAYLTMNRPEARNALSLEMRTEIRDRLQEAELNDDIRCIVLRGAGEHFLAGGDVKSFMEFTRLPPEERRLTFINRIHGLNSIMYAMRRLNKPVIASVRGAAAGPASASRCAVTWWWRPKTHFSPWPTRKLPAARMGAPPIISLVW